MANEVSIVLNSFNLDSTNSIAIEDIAIQIAKNIREVSLPRFDGSIVPIGKRKAISIKVKGTVIASDYDALRTNLDSIKSKLESSAEYSFKLDDDRFINAQYKNFNWSWKRIRTFAAFNFELIASDPFFYSNTLQSSTPSWTTGVGFTITNAGNAPTRAKITITAGAAAISDDLKVQNSTTGDIFKYRGTLNSSQALVVNNRVDSSDVSVTNNGTDDIVTFEGDFITLNPGNNTVILTSAASTATIQIQWRDSWY